MKTEKSLRARAMEMMSRREMSQAELRAKLLPHASDSDELDAVLAEFAQNNWQSDERFAEAFVRSKSSKHGAGRLRQELRQRGVSAELIQQYLPDRETELDNAIEVARKKFKQPAQNRQEWDKQMRFMLYRGFAMATAQAALKRAWADDEE
ncbi:recombination regulator RecX [Kingella kingae]|uniref:recombination regulator RecX n=1 Tax=Kingella kingae TaxID=504 RepID=UPI00254AC40D|nr:recombination regulator RecX [Kingella kingae]MDK4650335.1 recombination regulator RecX [Kingella kingae]